MDVLEMLQKAAQAFSPSAPIDQKALFAGRIEQLKDVVNAVNQRGQHVVLFGERGVGKTSLAKTISAIFSRMAIVPEPINCDPKTTFASLFKNALREITLTQSRQGVGFVGDARLETKSLDQLVGGDPAPDDIRRVLANLGQVIVVFDEIDRIQDKGVITLLADTVKTLSDHSVPTTVIMVGVADSVDALISEHQSIERALMQVRMPRMSKQELYEILDKGTKQLTMSIDPLGRERIAILSQGLPHYTHLLGLHACQAAIGEGKMHITQDHVRTAIEKAQTQAQQSIVSAYHKATSSPRENLYPQVLLACALARTDSLGYFAATDVRGPMSSIMGRPYDIPAFSLHLNKFCEPERGPVLQRSGHARNFRFRFINPLMQPYVIMDGLKRKLIDESTIGAA